MDAPESPGTQKVVGVLSRGEDTDGETSDLDVDYPSESFVSQLDDEGAYSCNVNSVANLAIRPATPNSGACH